MTVHPTLTSEQLAQLKRRPYAAVLIAEQGMPFDEAIALSPAELAQRVLVLPEWPAATLLPHRYHCDAVGEEEQADDHEMARRLIEHVKVHFDEVMGFNGRMMEFSEVAERFASMMLGSFTPGGRVSADVAKGLRSRRDFAISVLRPS